MLLMEDLVLKLCLLFFILTDTVTIKNKTVRSKNGEDLKPYFKLQNQ